GADAAFAEPAEARQDLGTGGVAEEVRELGDVDGHPRRPRKSNSFGSSMWLGRMLPRARIITSLRPGMRRSMSSSIAFMALRSRPSCEPQRSQGMMGKFISLANFARSGSAQ